MTERMTITDADVRVILDIVDRGRAGERGAYVPHSMLRDLAKLIPFDEATFQVMDLRNETISLQEEAEPDSVNDGGEHLDLWWPAFWECCAYPQRTGDYVTILRSSDVRLATENGPHWRRFLEAVSYDDVDTSVIVSFRPKARSTAGCSCGEGRGLTSPIASCGCSPYCAPI